MAATIPQQPTTTAQKLTAINEQTWLSMGNLAEMMTDYEKAMNCYESALRHNPYSIVALTQIASLCRGREQFARAVEYFKRILAIQENNGETWAALGHCYLMMDNLQEAYHAYQQALYHLSNPKDPKLWYGIGILYDRYGSLEHAEEAFSAVMKMDPKFEKANEIYFRLGIIYKQQQKFDLSLQCFRYILQSPPRPLTESDIWFQTGHVYEQQKEYEQAKEAYERVLAENPDHAKVLQQLGWLYHQQNTSFCNQSLAIQYLTRSLKSDSNDAQSWYLLGRCYMAEQNYNKAYEAYQQAVYRDARNPTFWCSIGVLYYQINQYRDALDAYSRAIRLNPYISEVWYDLGTLYESCNNQIQDALDAYQRAAELDPSNPHIKQRLELLRKSQSHTPQAPGSAPTPQDVSNPSQYQSGPNAQPLNGSSYGQSQAPSGPPNGISAYHTGPNAQQHQQRPEERGPPPHLPMTLPPSEGNAGPGRDLPMPNGPPLSAPPPPQQQQQSPSTGRRSPAPYPPPASYLPPAGSRDDVRIPDIGNGGGRAPTPSDRSQMNPIMQENGRSHPQHMPPQPTLTNLQQHSPYGKHGSSEGHRSPNLAANENKSHMSPHSRASHGSSPKQQHYHHRSPGEQQHTYDMSSHPTERPLAPEGHYRQEAYSRSNHPDPYNRGANDRHADIKQERTMPPLQETQPSSSIKQPYYNTTNNYPPHGNAKRESEQRYHESARGATDDDYDASAADMLLSIGQSRGDKRAHDDTRSSEESKRLRSNQDEDTDMTPSSSEKPSSLAGNDNVTVKPLIPSSSPLQQRSPPSTGPTHEKPSSPLKSEPNGTNSPKESTTLSLPKEDTKPSTPPTEQPKEQEEEEEEEEEGEVRDEVTTADIEMKEAKDDDKEEGEVGQNDKQTSDIV